MKFWQNVSWMETDQLVETAKFAEQVGFEGVMDGDHVAFPVPLATPYPYTSDGKPPMGPTWNYPDNFASAGAIAAVTVGGDRARGGLDGPVVNVPEATLLPGLVDDVGDVGVADHGAGGHDLRGDPVVLPHLLELRHAAGQVQPVRYLGETFLAVERLGVRDLVVDGVGDDRD